ADKLGPLAVGSGGRPECLVISNGVAYAGNFVLTERKSAKYPFCFLSAAFRVVLFVAADIVQNPRIYAHHHEPFDRSRFHPVAIGFNKDESGAVDAHTRAVEDAVAECFVV